MMLKTLAATALVWLAGATASQAATVYATDLDIVVDGPRGSTNDRDDPTNALGEALGDFFELGRGAVVDFTFGTLFTGSLNLVEVTFLPTAIYPESVDVFLGRNGDFQFLTSIANGLAMGPAGFTIDFGGVFDTVRVVDTTTFAGSLGFDVDRISVESVAPVPLPAAGVLLVGGLAALGLARRRAA